MNRVRVESRDYSPGSRVGYYKGKEHNSLAFLFVVGSLAGMSGSHCSILYMVMDVKMNMNMNYET